MTAKHRVEWTGTLRALGPISVGGGGMGDVDLAPVRDGADKVFIPGTTLAGVVRSLIAETSRDPFGSQDQASTIEVDDAHLHNAGPLELRDGVGIDRKRGAAADGIKFTRLVVPSRSTFSFRMTALVDDVDSLNPLIALLTQKHGIAVGGGTSRGLGRVQLQQPERSSVRLDRAGVLAWLSGGAPAQRITPAEIGPPAGATSEVIAVPWTAYGPVFVRAGTEGLAVDDLPLVSRDEGQAHLIIPGSSLKGVLRSHAERIERTVRGVEAPSEDFLDQVNDPRLTVTNRLFGTARPAKERAPIAPLDSGNEPPTGTSDASRSKTSKSDAGSALGRRSALAVDDCRSLWSCPTTRWDAIVHAASTADPDRLRALRDELAGGKGESPTPAPFQVGFHVGLDRWTSAPVDGALYSALEPWGIEWQPFSLRLDHRWLGDDRTAKAARFLFLLVLRDLCEGWLPLGHGPWRGYGDIRASAAGTCLDLSTWGAESLEAVIADTSLVEPLALAWDDETNDARGGQA